MVKIKMTGLSITSVVTRYYLMMTIAIILGFAQLWTLMAFISVAISASTIMGMSFTFGNNKAVKNSAGRIIQMDMDAGIRKAS